MKTIFTLIVCFITLSLSAQITTSSQWTWMKGDSIINQPSAYGSLGIPAAANKPGFRNRGVSWTDGSGNLWLFGGGYVKLPYEYYLSDLWKYDIATNQWTWVKGDSTTNQSGVYGIMGVAAATNKPGGKEFSSSWTDGSGYFWLFGGNTAGGIKSDLWKYNIATNQWTWMSGSKLLDQMSVFGTQGVSAPTNKPGARNGSLSWTDGSGNLWLFGGYGHDAVNNLTLLNELWKYNIATNQWTWVSGDNIGDQYAVYGTQGITASTNKPGGRYQGASWADGSGNLWLFGGYGRANSSEIDLNDLWKYNIASNQWTWIKGDSSLNHQSVYGNQGVASITNKPGARFLPAAWTDQTGFFWMFGGEGIPEFNDLWKYDPSTNQWTWMLGDSTGNQNGMYGTQGLISVTNKPGGRDGGVSWIDGSGNFWLLGGAVYDSDIDTSFLSDLWKLSSSPIPVTLTSIKAYQQSTGINVQWTFSQEIDMDRYEVEKSATGMNFGRGGSVIARNEAIPTTYNWLDINPNQGANFYRVKMIGKDGKETYSQIVKVVIAGNESISIYPNPIVNSSFALQLTNKPKGNYNIRILNSVLQVVYKNTINHNGGSSTQTIQLPLLLSKGIYNLEVVNPDGKVNTEKMVIQ